MAKPTKIPKFATGLSAQIVEPPLAKIELGHRANEQPTHAYENFLKHYAGEWCQYLHDAIFDGDHTVDGNLEVTGDLTVNGTLGTFSADNGTIDTLISPSINSTAEVHHTDERNVPVIGSILYGHTVVNASGGHLSAIPMSGNWNCKKFRCVAANQFGGGPNTLTVKLYEHAYGSVTPTLRFTGTISITSSSDTEYSLNVNYNSIVGVSYFLLEASGPAGDILTSNMHCTFTR